MPDERLKKVKELFLDALDLPEGERRDFLVRTCNGDDELRREIEELLSYRQEDGSFLETPSAGSAAEVARLVGDDTEVDMQGRTVGPFRLVREIGRGGMGTVFLAERADEEFEHRVALKLVKRGIDTEAVLERFRQERQILAGLDHPNIGRLLDGGSTDDGLPYVVMEYVEGTPIDDYCDDHHLSISRRVELVQDLCSAVHSAHQRLVVHRDIKPGNVLVTADGVPKLLDFGIAKLLDPDLESSVTEHTAFGARPLTPEYASPEQLRGEPVSTASDVYSLGVLLYELLTGHLPFRFPTRCPDEVSRIVTEADPDKPSTAISRIETTTGSDKSPTIRLSPELVSAPREGSPDRLRRRLAGDLDNITLKALAKEPENRYTSAEQLADDLRRHLDGLPVLARGRTWGYRAAKFVRRHRAGVMAAATVAIMAVALAVMSVRYAVDLRRERHAAEQKARESEEVTEFLIELFEVSDPASARGETITAREILDTGATRIAQELADQPVTRATLMQVIGRVYARLGLREEAAAILQEAVEIRRREAAVGDSTLAENLSILAEVTRELREYPQAEAFGREALATLEKSRPPTDPNLARTKSNLASCLRFTGKLDEADRLSREAYETLTSELDQNDSAVLYAMSVRAAVLRARGESVLAESFYRDLLARQREVLGSDHPHVPATLNNLGFLLRMQGRWSEAEASYREALPVLHRLVGEAHPDPVQVQLNLVSVLMLQGKADEAVSLMRRVVELRREMHGPGHWRVGSMLVNGLGDLMMDAGRYREAEPVLRQGLEIYEAALGPDHRWVAHARGNLGACLLGVGNRDEADQLITMSLESFRTPEALSADDWRVLHDIVKHLEALGETELIHAFRGILESREPPPGV